MWKKSLKTALALFSLVIFSMTSCHPKPETPVQDPNPNPDISDTKKPADDKKPPVSDNTSHTFFTFVESLDITLGKNLYAENKNIAYSPLGLGVPLSLVLDMAAPETQNQWLHALGYPQGFRMSQAVKAWNTAVQQDFKSRTGESERQPALTLANSAWIKEGEDIAPEKIEKLGKDLETETFCLPFNQQAKEKYQAWQKEKLNAVLSKGELFDNTDFIIANALNFHDQWRTPFNPELTAKKDFHNADQTQTPLDMMTMTADLSYYENEDFAATILNTEQQYEVELILPKSGHITQALAQTATQNNLPYHEAEVTLTLPKFSIQSDEKPDDALKKSPFSPLLASFPAKIGKTGDVPLKISEISQLSDFHIDEKGLAVKVLTQIGIKQTARPTPKEQKTLVFDRPFILKINKKLSSDHADQMEAVNVFTLVIQNANSLKPVSETH